MLSTFDLHVHTTSGSSDSSLTPEQMVAEAKRIGLTGAVLTEHNGWPRHDFEVFARKQDLVIVRALEVDTNVGHVIALGLDSYETGVSNIRELRKVVDRVGGFMILAHPFRFLFNPAGHYTRNLLYVDPKMLPRTPEEAASHPVFQLIDEVEVVNGGNIEEENRFAQRVAGILGRQGTGGSDAHSTHGFGKGVTLFEGHIRNERDILEALRSGSFTPVEGFHVGRISFYGKPLV